MNLRRTAQAFLTALALLGVSAAAQAHDGLVGRDEPARTEMTHPARLHLALLRRLEAVNQQLAKTVDKKPVPPAVANQVKPHLHANIGVLRTRMREIAPRPTGAPPARKITPVKKGKRPTPAEAGRAPSFPRPSAR